MAGLRAVLDGRTDFSDLAGVNVLGCVTVTPGTGVLVLTLAALGANVRWCSDNRFASDDDVVDHLTAEGIPVFARANMTTDAAVRTDQHVGPRPCRPADHHRLPGRHARREAAARAGRRQEIHPAGDLLLRTGAAITVCPAATAHADLWLPVPHGTTVVATGTRRRDCTDA